MRIVGKQSIGALLLGAVAFIPATAVAGPIPKLSGKYALSLSTSCQVTMDVTTNGFSEVSTVNNGKLEQAIGLATFADSGAHKGSLAFDGVDVHGAILYVPELSPSSDLLTTEAGVQTGSFSIPSSSSLVLNGVTYFAVYGHVDGDIAHYVTFLAQIAKPGPGATPSDPLGPTPEQCIAYGTAVHE